MPKKNKKCQASQTELHQSEGSSGDLSAKEVLSLSGADNSNRNSAIVVCFH